MASRRGPCGHVGARAVVSGGPCGPGGQRHVGGLWSHRAAVRLRRSAVRSHRAVVQLRRATTASSWIAEPVRTPSNRSRRKETPSRRALASIRVGMLPRLAVSLFLLAACAAPQETRGTTAAQPGTTQPASATSSEGRAGMPRGDADRQPRGAHSLPLEIAEGSRSRSSRGLPAQGRLRAQPKAPRAASSRTRRSAGRGGQRRVGDGGRDARVGGRGTASRPSSPGGASGRLRWRRLIALRPMPSVFERAARPIRRRRRG